MGHKRVEQRRKAFELWMRLKSIAEVSKVPGMPKPPTLSRWKKEDRWEERAEQIKTMVKDQYEALEKAKDNVLVEEDVKYLRLLSYLENLTLENIMEKRIEQVTWKDAIDTLRFTAQERRLILGLPTERTETEVLHRNLSDEELEERIKRQEEILRRK